MVGSVLLDQLASQRERLAREFNIDLRVRGILGSKFMFWPIKASCSIAGAMN